MREEFDELKSLILKENPFAYYIHCFANQFQLVVVSVARSINVVSEFFYYVDRIVNIVGDSCGTKDVVLPEHCGKIVEKLERDGTLPGKGKHHESDLVGPAHTRWGSYYATLLHLLTMWDEVLDALVTVCDSDINPEQVGTASGLIQKMESFEFVFILHLMVQVLGWTEDLSRLLEQKDKYIVNAMELIVLVRDVLQDMQENRWGEFFEEVKSFCVAMSVPVPSMDDSIPVRGRSRRRRLFVTCYHHYHVEIFIALIDSITIDINNRFSKTSMELLRCIACLDPSDSFSKFNYAMLLRLAEIYSVDFSIFDREILKEQLHMFVLNVRSTSDFSSCHDLATLAVRMVQTETHLIFPLVYRLIELSLILPVATATTERAFSARNINNTELCDEINNKWLNDMMLCYVEREIFSGIDDAKILQYFESMRG